MRLAQGSTNPVCTNKYRSYPSIFSVDALKAGIFYPLLVLIAHVPGDYKPSEDNEQRAADAASQKTPEDEVVRLFVIGTHHQGVEFTQPSAA